MPRMGESAYCHRWHVDRSIFANAACHPSRNGVGVGVGDHPNDNEFHARLSRRPSDRMAFHINDDSP
jgi:hypothetical protein